MLSHLSDILPDTCELVLTESLSELSSHSILEDCLVHTGTKGIEAWVCREEFLGLLGKIVKILENPYFRHETVEVKPTIILDFINILWWENDPGIALVVQPERATFGLENGISLLHW